MTTQETALTADQTVRGPGILRRIVRSPSTAMLWVRGALGRHLSVRWKLTLWYGIMLGATLALLGLGMQLAIQNAIRTSIDSRLQTTAQRLSVQLRENAGPPTASPRQAFLLYAANVQYALYRNSYQPSEPGQSEQVEIEGVAGLSCILVPQARNPCDISAPGGIPLTDPSDVLLLSSVASNRVSAYRDIHYGSEVLRAYFAPLDVPKTLRAQGVGGVLEVFQAERNYLDIQNTITLILVFGIPLMLVVALAGGWWIARAALRPIDRISRTVHAIGESHDLSRRLEFVGPMDEVGRLAETFDGMMDRIEKVFETQRRFVADASHELRTPLTTIRGNAELFAIAPPEEREICVASIRREAERMSRLVADLLLLAAADIEEQPVHMRAVGLDELLREVHRSALVLAGDSISVELDAPEPVAVQADPDRIKQLMLNLVDNAIKFTPAGGRVTIRLTREPGGARIEVADTGVGIPPAEQEAIFERFYRLEQARSKRGSGLGLAICAWIVEAHHGRIEVQSQPGKGSVFTVHLPSTPVPAA